MSDKDNKHAQAMKKQKKAVDSHIERANEERGVMIILTGNGKGKSSSAFGMVMRALGYGHKVGIVQFIKGQQLSGEELYVKQLISQGNSQLYFHQMGTGFTWDTQDRQADIVAAKASWRHAEKLLSDDSYQLIILDELTYMLAYKYLDHDMVLNSLKNRPFEQSVVVTGRGGGSALQDIADTVSEIKDIKHAYNSGIKARKGVDF